MAVCLRCLLHHILSLIAYTFRENWDFVSIIIVQFMMSANNWIRLLADRIRLFAHYTISLSLLCKLIWRHWTKKPVRFILSSVWVSLSIFSQLSIIQFMGQCVFISPNSLVTNERIYTLSYYHNQIGTMNDYPLSRVRSWSNGMGFMSLYILLLKDSLDPSAFGELTHWGRVTHICVGKLAIIGSNNGLSPGRRQVIIWTNAGIL